MATRTLKPIPPSYIAEQWQAIGPYAVQLWCNTGDKGVLGIDNVATASAGGQNACGADVPHRGIYCSKGMCGLLAR